MRAWEILTENYVPPSRQMTVRHLHDLKKEEKNRLSNDQKRRSIIPIMYGDSQWEREMLELERMRLELAQMRAEIAATEAETAAKSRDAISDMARSGIKAENQTKQKITAMAKRGLGRRKKCSTVF
jgi:hypothetical protein